MMIRIARSDLSNDGTGRSALGLENGEFVAMARKGPSRIVRAVERFVAQRPGFCLAVALTVGVALGWWVKRQ